MVRAATTSGLRSRLRRFGRDRGGVSAVEFALVLPVMLTLYIGSVELGDGFAVQYKATLAARTVTNLASEYTSIDATTMSEILGAGATVVAPYSASNMAVTLSEISTNSKGQGTVTWSASLNGTARTAGQAITLPTNLQSANLEILFGEVTYPYTPSLGYVLTGTFNMYQTQYFYPRMSTCVTYNGAC